MKTSRLMSFSLKLLLTLLLLFLIAKSAHISKIGNDLKSFSGKSLALLLVLCWAGQLLCSERWRIFAASLQMRGTYRSFVRMYFAGMLFNIGLPSLVGGDIVKAYIISRKTNKSIQIGLASILQDRAAGLISLLVYGSICILIHPISWQGIPLWCPYLALWVAIALLLWLVFKGDRLYGRYLKPGHPILVQKALQRIAEFHRSLGMSSLASGAAIRIVLYSFIYSGLVLWVFRQVTVAAGHEVKSVPFSALFPLITIGTMLPLTLGGLGIREWLYVEALSLVGIPRDQGLVISLATSALYLASNFAGIAFLPAIPRELRSRTFDFPENADTNDAAEDRISQQNDII
jgi:glycosyltransferase 2 family protein